MVPLDWTVSNVSCSEPPKVPPKYMVGVLQNIPDPNPCSLFMTTIESDQGSF